MGIYLVAGCSETVGAKVVSVVEDRFLYYSQRTLTPAVFFWEIFLLRPSLLYVCMFDMLKEVGLWCTLQ